VKALVIEDERVICDLMVGILQKSFDFESVLSAYDGLDANELLHTYSFDLVILDINIPKISGLQLLKRIREEEGSHCGIVMVSGALDSRVAQIASDFSVDSMIAKPFDTNLFIQNIEKYMNSKININRAV